MAQRYDITVTKKETHIEAEMEEDEDGEWVHEDDYLKLFTALVTVRNELPPGSLLRKYINRVITDA